MNEPSHPRKMIHFDMDAFFVSVEHRSHPRRPGLGCCRECHSDTVAVNRFCRAGTGNNLSQRDLNRATRNLDENDSVVNITNNPVRDQLRRAHGRRSQCRGYWDRTALFVTPLGLTLDSFAQPLAVDDVGGRYTGAAL
jgi:hypothetical protein